MPLTEGHLDRRGRLGMNPKTLRQRLRQAEVDDAWVKQGVHDRCGG
jgi:hypothetical protein